MRALHAEASRRVRADGLAAAWRGVGPVVPFLLLFVLVAYWWYVMAILDRPVDWGFDFRQFWQGGRDVAHGVSPYPSEALLASADEDLGPGGIQVVFRFPYPAGAAVLLAPLGALDFDVAAGIWGALLIAALAAALRVLGVRDWRVYAVVASSYPVLSAVRLGTFTPLLILLAALAWRFRDRPFVSGGSVALAISLKLFLWPLVVWLAATRRLAAAATAALGAAAITATAWAVLGFDGLARYPEQLHKLAEIVSDRGFSLVALGVEAGLAEQPAELLPPVVGVVLLAWLVLLGRRSEAASFSVAIVAALALTPIVWCAYFALLVLPLALARSRFAAIWVLPWLFWLLPSQENEGDLWRIVVAYSLVAALLVATLRARWEAPRVER